MLDRSTFPVGSHRRADRTIRPTGWNYQKSYSPEGNEEGELHADLNRMIAVGMPGCLVPPAQIRTGAR
jgi:hypothetical protein